MPVISRPVRVAAWLSRLIGMTILLVAGGCSSDPQCENDLQCGPNKACVKEMCLERVVRTLALEIVPMTDSVSAPTEVIDLTSEALEVVAARKTTIHGTVAPPSPEDMGIYTSREAHVVVTVPSLIPGRSALSLPQITATSMTNSTTTAPTTNGEKTGTGELQFDLEIAENRLGAPATMRFTPASTARQQPPVVLTRTLAPSLDLSFPKQNQMTVIGGLLQDPTGRPVPNFVVRAWQGSTLVSSLDATDSGCGAFRPIAPTDGLMTSPVFLTMDFVDATNTPAEMNSVPQFVSAPFVPPAAPAEKTACNDPPVFHIYTMPAYAPAVASTPFVVLAGDKPQSQVTTRFRAEIPGPEGKAVYERSAVSDMDGMVQVPLITDGQGNALTYQVFLQPPNSDFMYPYASECLPAVVIDGSLAGSATPMHLNLANLRKGLSGYVFGKGSNGADVPVVGAQITATQISSANGCSGAVTPNPALVTADATGYYLLLLDPGTYRLDIVPPAASPWPRLTEDGDSAILVDMAGPPQHNINLPAGEVVDGMVMDADGVGLPNAGVRIFELACKNPTCTDPPRLLADVKTDAVTDGTKVVGHFRTVLPPQP